MKRAILFLFSILACINVSKANDGVYFTSGNFLIPAHETDIAAAKEILTVTIGTDSFATVDVYYEFLNPSHPKTVKMAFEAASPYNDNRKPNLGGTHPYIKDFTVTINGKHLTYHNGIAASFENNDRDIIPLDLDKWKGHGQVPDSILPANDALYNAQLDSIVPYAYVYWFEAPFKEGINTVHHTYRYRMSYDIARVFTIPYRLTPATRWQNRQIDNFTLRIKADATTEFCLPDSIFRAAPFTSAKRREIYRLTTNNGTPFIFAILHPDDTISWHSAPFRPQGDMTISSPAWSKGTILRKSQTEAKVVIDAEGHTYRYLADSRDTDSYFVEVQDYGTVTRQGSHLEERNASRGQGYIFINGPTGRRVNIRRRPEKKSPIVCTISDNPGYLPDAYPCLGTALSADGTMWYKTKVHGKLGFIRQDLMEWDAINPF